MAVWFWEIAALISGSILIVAALYGIFGI